MADNVLTIGPAQAVEAFDNEKDYFYFLAGSHLDGSGEIQLWSRLRLDTPHENRHHSENATDDSISLFPDRGARLAHP